MRKFRQFKRLRYIALIALIGAAFLLFRWTEQEKFSLAKMGEFQDEYVHAFFSEIDSREHPNCKKIREEYPLIEDQDGDMDIAFTLVVHKDVVQIIRLLRMIYRKNNYYCIHPDARSNVTFVNALQGAASCFGKNVELVPQERRIIVTWGYETVLKPHLICGEQALRRHSTWSYLINAVGQEFPLRTNLEIIAALKALNGSNLIESGSLESLKYRVRGTILPLKAKWIKGSIYGAFRREFIYEAALGTSVSEIREFLLRPKFILHPDELYFSSLAFNPHLGMPGACNGEQPMTENGIGFLGKFVIWYGTNIPCLTKYVRRVCILGKPHIPMLQKAPHLFANKFHVNYHPEAYTQLESWYFKKVSKERVAGTYSRTDFDPSIYANRSCSRNHLP